MGDYFVNSLIVTVGSTILVLALSSTSAFALARFEFRLKGLVWGYILFGFLIPHSILLIPLAIFTREIGLYNSLPGLALVYAAVGIPWNVFFLRAFMETIPRELEEAAVIDGAGMWDVFRDVILPLSTPALATMATFHVLSAWSEYILALVLTGPTESRTLPVGVSLLEGHFTSNEPGVAAGMVITIVPAVLAFVFLQRYVVKGLTAGALKA
jgi:ABC-type glycerol-3-phosphate transport system permease component